VFEYVRDPDEGENRDAEMAPSPLLYVIGQAMRSKFSDFWMAFIGAQR
jgi:hypothetical protein